MSDERTYSAEQYQAIKEDMLEYKAKLKALTKERDELVEQHEKTVKELTKERDEAVKQSAELQQAYEQFTSENELYQENLSLKQSIRERELIDAFSSVDGVDYQEGVGLEDLLRASGVKLPEIGEEIPETFVTDVLEKARAAKPFLFVQPAVQDAKQVESVTQESIPAPGLRAFGAQTVGGGAAAHGLNSDTVKSVDFTSYEAARAFAERLRSASKD